jgi:two-component system, NarL family, response regulator DesR
MPFRVLIADDNSVVRTAMRQLFDPGDHEVIEAEDGYDAVRKTIELRPQVVILDLVMPDMDGLAAAREISQQFPELPLLMYTMHSSRALEIEAQKVGIRKVLPKSDSSLLIAAVEQLRASHPADDKATPAPVVIAGNALVPDTFLSATTDADARDDGAPDLPKTGTTG